MGKRCAFLIGTRRKYTLLDSACHLRAGLLLTTGSRKSKSNHTASTQHVRCKHECKTVRCRMKANTNHTASTIEV